MDSIAQYALIGSILVSALGGIALCVIVILYGFLPPEDESAVDARRRIFAVRLGHTAAAVCFAATALLAVIVLSRQAGGGSAPGSGLAAGELDELDTRVSAMERLVERIAASMDTLVSRTEPAKGESASAVTAPAGGGGGSR